MDGPAGCRRRTRRGRGVVFEGAPRRRRRRRRLRRREDFAERRRAGSHVAQPRLLDRDAAETHRARVPPARRPARAAAAAAASPLRRARAAAGARAAAAAAAASGATRATPTRSGAASTPRPSVRLWRSPRVRASAPGTERGRRSGSRRLKDDAAVGALAGAALRDSVCVAATWVPRGRLLRARRRRGVFRPADEVRARGSRASRARGLAGRPDRPAGAGRVAPDRPHAGDPGPRARGGGVAAADARAVPLGDGAGKGRRRLIRAAARRGVGGVRAVPARRGGTARTTLERGPFVRRPRLRPRLRPRRASEREKRRVEKS